MFVLFENGPDFLKSEGTENKWDPCKKIIYPHTLVPNVFFFFPYFRFPFIPFKTTMASNLVCKVHPLCLFTIIDAYERRNEDAKRVIGTLLGMYILEIP